MAKRVFLSLAIIILSVLCCSVCFAADNNSNVNLGEQITDSLDKTGDSVRNAAGDVMNTIDGDNNRTRNNNNNNYNMNNGTSKNNNNNYTNGTGYNAVRTSVDQMTTGNMSTTTWIWIILAVAAIVIVAMVWYYAVQNNDRD